jgi:hypothetical protein
MPLPALPAAYTAIASLLARKGAVEATKKYGPKAVKEVQKITTKMKKKSKVGKENEFEDTLGSTPASTKLSNRQVEKFLKEHGYKEKNPSKLKEGDISYQFKINNKGKEDIIVYEKVGDKITKTNFTNSSIRKLADWQGYAEGGIVKNSLLTDDRDMYREGGGPGIEALRKVAPEVVERMGYEEGGSIDNQMLMVMTPTQEPEMAMESDDDMEDGYTRFIMEEALSEEEEDMLMSKLEQDEELSMLFDKVIDVAQEFAGSGPVEGPGSGVSDSIPARLSDGEFVFTAKAVEEIGEDTLMSMMKDAEAKADERQGLAEGGMLEEEKPEGLLTQSGIVQEDTIAEDELKKRMVQGSASYVRS